MLEASIHSKYLCPSSNARYLIAFPFVNCSTSSHIIWPLLIATLAYFSRPNFFLKVLTMNFVHNSSEWNHCLHGENLKAWTSMEHVWLYFYFSVHPKVGFLWDLTFPGIFSKSSYSKNFQVFFKASSEWSKQPTLTTKFFFFEFLFC